MMAVAVEALEDEKQKENSTLFACTQNERSKMYTHTYVFYNMYTLRIFFRIL